MWILIFFPPLWPVLLLLLLFSTRHNTKRTANATERIAAVVAPQPQHPYALQLWALIIVGVLLWVFFFR